MHSEKVIAHRERSKSLWVFISIVPPLESRAGISRCNTDAPKESENILRAPHVLSEEGEQHCKKVNLKELI